jgi:UDP-N-acetylglucosamine 2-epimerase (non-hydrolysing)
MKIYKKYKNIKPILVHTGQHYDANMSDTFFKELKIPKPDYNLGIGSGSHAEQTAKTMIEFEKVCLKEKPDLVIVVGDVNATIACALVAVKLNIKVAHVEAGLRSYNKNMPEEINRILTDSISDYLFVSEYSGFVNLEKEGIPFNKIYYVGNVMIDTLLNMLPKIKLSKIMEELKLKNEKFIILTIHRPSNVDNKNNLKKILEIIYNIQKDKKIIWPIHPRTKKNIELFGFNDKLKTMNNLIITNPLGYTDFMNLIINCEFVITDSGGIQEEATYLKKFCITLRDETERPVTLMTGFNILTGNDKDKIFNTINNILNKKYDEKGFTPDYWDGKASRRIVEIINEKYENGNL